MARIGAIFALSVEGGFRERHECSTVSDWWVHTVEARQEKDKEKEVTMSRTKGAINKPKELESEMAKLRKLYEDRGVAFPVDGAKLVPEPKVVTPRVSHKAKRHDPVDPLSFRVSDNRSDQKGGSLLECGSCHSELDKECPVCPFCNTPLTWEG